MLRKTIVVGPAVSLALLGGIALGGCGGSSGTPAAPSASQTGHEAMKGEGAAMGNDKGMKSPHKSMHQGEAMQGSHHAMKGHSPGGAMGEEHMGG